MNPNSKALIGISAPDFVADVDVHGHLDTVKLSDFLGKHVALLFVNFDSVSPTEFAVFSKRAEELKNKNVAYIVCSTDPTFYAHAWISESFIEIPVIVDENRKMVRDYGVESAVYRAQFIIDPIGILRKMTVGDYLVSQLVDQTLLDLETMTRTMT